MPGAMDFGIADHSQGAGREQAAQIAIAAFADIAKPVDLASVNAIIECMPYTTRLESAKTSGAAQVNAKMIVAEMRSIGRSFATFDE